MTRCFPLSVRKHHDGLTLVEVLVVLSIVAIVADAAMLRLGVGQASDGLTASANALALAITAASDRAQDSGHDERLEILPERYRIARTKDLETAPWQELADCSFTDSSSEIFTLASDGTSAPISLRLRSARMSASVRLDGLQADFAVMT